MKETIKKRIQNYGLLLCTIVVMYLVLEGFMLFGLPYLPLRLQGYLPRAVRLLAQTSKNGVKPKNYIALFGDSYAQGQGEWLLTANKWKNPDYGSQHILYRSAGRDVLSFGAGGVGSLGGIVAKPINGLKYLNSTLFFGIEKPSTILVYFYEGNDLNNNLNEIEKRFQKQYDSQRLRDKNYFRNFIENTVIAQDRYYNEKGRSFRWYHNLIFSQMIKNILRGPQREVDEENLRKKKNKGKRVFSPEGTINRVRVDGKEVPIPDNLQSPALELTGDEIDLGLYVFGESLRYMAGFFKDAKIYVVYIPSPLSSYAVASKKVSIQSYHGRDELYDAGEVSRKNDLISRSIKRITEENGCAFIDTTASVRKASQTALLHGPSEWKHFNKRGYSAIAETILLSIQK